MDSDGRNKPQPQRYEAPRIERRIEPAELQREFAYAGVQTLNGPG